MITVEHTAPRRDLAIFLAVAGTAALLVTLPLGARATTAGVVAMGACMMLAALETRRRVVTWTNAVAGLVVVVWFIPIKGYALPVDLPFNVEHYRLAILALVLVLAVAVAGGHRRISFGGRVLTVLLLGGTAVAAAALNAAAIDEASGEPGAAIKSLSYFLSFLIVFVLVSSVVDSLEAIDTILRTVVVGACVVGAAAIYEARSGYNLFDHLHEWIPAVDRQFRDVASERGGRFRVYSSAQHPIALAVALTLALPIAAYLSTRAQSVARSRAWLAAGGLIAIAVGTTISRTPVVMLIVMVVVALVLRPREMARYWPTLLVLPVALHFVAPGAMGGIYKSFFPEEGLVESLGGRAGEGGSGRFADVSPGLTIWSRKPLVGHGLGNAFPSTDASQSPGQAPPDIIFDNQYLDVTVKLGVLGLVGSIVFFWGGAISLLRAARRARGPDSDLLTACSIAAFGFAASMFFFDAYAFVQATLFAILVIAVGYRCIAFSRGRYSTEPSEGVPA